MKNYSTAIAAKISSEEFLNFMAVDLCFSSTYNYTDSNIPIHYGGVRYVPTPMQLSEISYAAAMSVDRVTISFGNADQTLSGILLTEDVRNKVVKVYFGVYDPASYSVVGLDQVWHGIVDEWSLTEEKAEIVTVNEFILWKKRPLRSASATCPWAFRGTECGYAGGGAWCDQSYARCSELGNTTNFGGFRFAPAMSEKEIWWGKVPK